MQMKVIFINPITLANLRAANSNLIRKLEQSLDCIPITALVKILLPKLYYLIQKSLPTIFRL